MGILYPRVYRYGFNEYIPEPALPVGSSFSTVIRPVGTNLQPNPSPNGVITCRVTVNRPVAIFNPTFPDCCCLKKTVHYPFSEQSSTYLPAAALDRRAASNSTGRVQHVNCHGSSVRSTRYTHTAHYTTVHLQRPTVCC